MKFNYITSTDEELLQHILSSSSTTISVAKKYHEVKGNFDVVHKINLARNLAQQIKLQQRINKLKGAQNDSRG